jgi:hypothetical protein
MMSGLSGAAARRQSLSNHEPLMTNASLMSGLQKLAVGLRPKLGAAAVHLALSALVAGAVAALVLGIWYPMPFREISGGRELFFLVISVDLVLGPLVTLVIFDRLKPFKALRRDLAIVAALQLAGLAYGVHTVWLVRPVYMVFEVDRFQVVRAIDVDDADLAQAPEGLRVLPFWGPGLIMAQPAEGKDAMRVVEQALAGRDIHLQPGTWRPYAMAVPAVRARAKPLAGLLREQPLRRSEVEAAVRLANLPMERMAYLPILARETGWVALVDTLDARVIGYLPFGGF